MQADLYLKEIQKLNPQELFGKRYFEKTGKYIYYSQYLYLLKYDFEHLPLTEINSPEAVRSQKEAEAWFHEKIEDGTLPEGYFFSPDRNIEVEKTLRYIDIPAHRHGFIECACVLNGTLRHIIGDQELVQPAGTFTYLPSAAEHCLQPEPDCLCLTIKVKSSTFLKFQLPNFPYFSSPLIFSFGSDSYIREQMAMLCYQQEQELTYSDTIMENIFQTMMIYLMQNYMETITFPVPNQPARKEIIEILNFMFENYQDVTLKSLSEEFHYSESYLSNLFHHYTGETFSQVLRRHKLQRAKEYLITTKWNLERICENVGYKDTTQFIRIFKEQYGCTPGQYRKQHKDT